MEQIKEAGRCTAEVDPALDPVSTVKWRPLVAMHVRTGWADVVDNWDFLDCSEHRHLNTTGELVRDRFNSTLDTLLDKLVHAANTAFGQGSWDLFVASDAPGVKRWVRDTVKGCAATSRHSAEVRNSHHSVGSPTVLFGTARTGHNNQRSAKVAADDFGAAAVRPPRASTMNGGCRGPCRANPRPPTF